MLKLLKKILLFGCYIFNSSKGSPSTTSATIQLLLNVFHSEVQECKDMTTAM